MNPVWDRAFKTLAEEGFDVYPPTTKTGTCKAPYVVIKDEGTNRADSISSTLTYYTVMCYVPLSGYSELYEYKESVKKALKALEPMLMPTHYETPSFYDDTLKAHMISVQYRNYRKL